MTDLVKRRDLFKALLVASLAPLVMSKARTPDTIDYRELEQLCEEGSKSLDLKPPPCNCWASYDNTYQLFHEWNGCTLTK